MELMKRDLISTSGVSRHDMLLGKPIEDWFDSKTMCAESSWMAAPFIGHHCVQDAALIHNVRNPLSVVSSYVCDTPMFSDAPGDFQIHNEFIRQYAPEVLEPNSPVERACLFWVRWNEIILSEATRSRKRYLLARVEDGASIDLMNFLDADPALREKAYANSKANSWKRRENDLSLKDIPDGVIKRRFVEIAARLGYPEIAAKKKGRIALAFG